MNCPQCGTPLSAYTELVFGSRALGDDRYTQTGWEACEDCADEAALLRLAGNRPLLFAAEPRDECDGMGQMFDRGEGGWPTVR